MEHAVRIKRILIPGLLLLSMLASVVGQANPAASDDVSAVKHGQFEVRAQGESLRDILQDVITTAGIAGIAIGHTVVGNIDVPIHGTFKERTVPLLIQRIVRAADFLAVQRGNNFTIYGNGTEETLDNREISYVHHLRALPVDTSLSYLRTFDVKAIAINESNAIALRGTLADVRDAVFFLETIDTESPIVMIELLVVEYRHGNRFDWGIDITNGKMGRLSTASLNAVNLPNASFSYSYLDTLDPAFAVNISALIQNNIARVITNPHIAVRNGETGTVRLEEQKNIVLQDANTEAGIVTSTIKQLEAGVALTVKPYITADGLILLQLDGNLSVFIPSPTKEYNIDKNIVQTEVNVRDGQTLIIGGLIKREQSDGKSGIPGLSKLPLIGSLFRREGKLIDHFETVIYITPHVYPLKSYLEMGSRDDLKFWMKEIESNDAELNKMGR